MVDYITWALSLRPAILISLFAIAWTLIYISRRLFFHPLRHIPGPLLRRFTNLPLLYTSYIGTEATSTARLHDRYGPIVLLGPNDVDISDSDAIQQIYVDKGGFSKIESYRNYDVDGHQSIFSTLDPVYRSKRSKAVMSIFATAKIRQACEEGNVIEKCVEDYVHMLQGFRQAGLKTVDILDQSRKLANEALTGYLFGRRYSAFEAARSKEKDTRRATDVLSATAFVEAFVAVGRFYLLPPWAFNAVLSFMTRFIPDTTAEASESLVNDYVASVVDEVVMPNASLAAEDTYQKRLLDAGISREETIAQCKDLIFAGTDSTSTTLSTILWHLARQPETLKRLGDELSAVKGQGLNANMPYLHATVKEGLRVGMANPPRLPRCVPEAGWSYRSTYLPAGTGVGCSSFVLHFDPTVFPDPFAFRPERWLDGEDGDADDAGGRTKEQLARQRAAWFAFGAGTRQCIARTFATEEVTLAVRRVVESGVLDGCDGIGERIGLIEWFNSKIIGGKVEIAFQ